MSDANRTFGRGGGGPAGQRPVGPTPGQSIGRRLVSAVRTAVSEVFTPRESYFDPQQPIAPQAPDSVAGRQWDYPPGYNIQIKSRQNEEFGFEQLRSLAKLDIIASLITRRIDQIVILDWQIRPKGNVSSESGPGVRNDPRIRELEEFFAEPSPLIPWDQWARAILMDLLEIDAPAVYVRRNRGGGMYSLDYMDGALITPKIGFDGRTPLPPAPAYQQVIHGIPAVDYTTNELIYYPWHPRTYRVYGKSPVEDIALTINMALRRSISQLASFTAGTIPDGFMNAPEGWSQAQIETFQKWFDSILAGDLERRRQVQLVPFGAKFSEWKAAPLKDDFDEWLARVACFCFSYPATPFIKAMNRSTAEQSQDTAVDEGREPLKKYFKSFIDRAIRTGWGYRDLEFIWVDKRTVKPVDQSDIDRSDIDSGIRTRAEVRAARGLDDIEGSNILTITTGQGLVPVSGMEQMFANQALQGPLNAGNLAGGTTSGGQPTSQGGAPRKAAAPAKTAAKPKKKVEPVAKVARAIPMSSFSPHGDIRVIDRDHDVRWMSCLSRDGHTMYVDRTLPHHLVNNGRSLDPAQPLLRHEASEYARMTAEIAAFEKENGRAPSVADREKIYLEAHTRAGTPAEKAWMEENGYDWDAWEAWCRGELSRLESRRGDRPPPDVDVIPAPHGRGNLEESISKIAKPEPRSLFVMRRLANPHDLQKWARSAGFETTVDDPHVTVAFSKAPIDWESVGESYEEVAVSGGARTLAKFGDAVVLQFESEDLLARWGQIRDAGASWEHDGYKPHVTITYNAPENFALEALQPYDGDLIFGYEVFREVDENWKDKVKEE